MSAAVSRQILSMQKIDKRFTGVHALHQVDFDLDEGEIHRGAHRLGAQQGALPRGEQLADTDEFRLQLENEFPSGIEVREDGESGRVWKGYSASSIAELDSALAKTEGVDELTEDHWKVVNFLREYYEEYQIAPAVRVLTKAVGKKMGKDKGNSKYLYGLFPYGPGKQACRYAGLPKPTGCV